VGNRMPGIGMFEMDAAGPDLLKLRYSLFQFEERDEGLELLRLPHRLSVNPA